MLWRKIIIKLHRFMQFFADVYFLVVFMYFPRTKPHHHLWQAKVCPWGHIVDQSDQTSLRHATLDTTENIPARMKRRRSISTGQRIQSICGTFSGEILRANQPQADGWWRHSLCVFVDVKCHGANCRLHSLGNVLRGWRTLWEPPYR